MNKTIYKIAPHILAASAVFAAGTQIAFAETVTYAPLTTIPGVFTAGVATNPVSVVKGIYGLAIGAGSIIAVVMIIMAGFKYMYEESISGKSGAKEQIQNAFLGLIVILGSYILLRTVNAELVNFNPQLPGGTGGVSGLVAAGKEYEAEVKKALVDNVERAKQISELTASLPAKDAKITDLKSQLTVLNLQNSFQPSSELDAKIKALQEQITQAQADRDSTQNTINVKTVEDLSKRTDNAVLSVNNSMTNEWSSLSTGRLGSTYDEISTKLDVMSGKIENQISVVADNIKKMENVPIFGDATNPDVVALDAKVAKAKQDAEYLKTAQNLVDLYKNRLSNVTGSSNIPEVSYAFSQAYEATLKKEQELRQAGRGDLADKLGKNLDMATDAVKSAFIYRCSQGSTNDVKNSFVCQPASGS